MKKLTLPKNESSFLFERFVYETDSRKKILKFMRKKNLNNTLEFKQIQEHYNLYFSAFNNIKNNFFNINIKPFLTEDEINNSTWYVNFETKEIIIE